MPTHVWFSGQVEKGDQLGRTIGFPTLNLQPAVLPPDLEHGVYAAEVLHDGQAYAGALFYGPRRVLGEEQTVLEIFLLDFDQEIYEHRVQFRLHAFVRPVLNFNSFAEMKTRLQEDVLAVQEEAPHHKW